MDVWIVVDRIDHHGAEIIAVFSTERDAKDFAAERDRADESVDYTEVEHHHVRDPVRGSR